MDGSTGPTDPDRVELFTRSGCHLCEEARVVVSEVCAQLGVGWTEVDIDGDPLLRRRHGEFVPVVHVDGRPHDYWRVDPARFERALRRG